MRGSIIKRGGTYAVVVELDRDPATGKRRRKWHSGYRTRRDAEAARIEILGRLQRGEFVGPSKLALGEYLTERWLPTRESRAGAVDVRELRLKRAPPHSPPGSVRRACRASRRTL